MLFIFFAILPVFILIAIGYWSVRFNYLPQSLGDALNAFAVKIAVPARLFRAMMNLDFATAISPPALISFYAGAFTCFALGIITACKFFARRPGESVAVGFAAQDILKNIFGGIMILFDRPFQVGDKIEVLTNIGRGQLVVSAGTSRYVLGRGLARKIMVEPEKT